MKKFKKMITLGLTCAMVLSASLAVPTTANAANTNNASPACYMDYSGISKMEQASTYGNSSAACLRCGYKGALTYQTTPYFCGHATYCHAPLMWYYCTACLSAYNACTAGHLQ